MLALIKKPLPYYGKTGAQQTALSACGFTALLRNS